MEFNTVDLHKELQKERKKNPSESVIEEANRLIKNEFDLENSINTKIKELNNDLYYKVNAKLDSDRIFTIDQIRAVCIKYRLRFLDSGLFKNEIPKEAIFEVKRLEKEWDFKTENFKIIAPKKLFTLTDKDSDPILFVPIGENKFYFIHKWGGELNRLRSTLAYPLRNVETLFVTLAVLATVFSALIPTDNTTTFIFLAVHSFIALCGLACLIIMTLHENFSDREWDSKYFN